MDRKILVSASVVVVKVGSNLLANPKGGIDTGFLVRLAGEIAHVRGSGRRVVLVSSGAVASGMAELGLAERPKSLPEIQAAAAVGQSVLMQLYRDAFAWHRVPVGQVLLTRDCLQDRRRFLHARNTLHALLGHGVLPIVNENDTVAVEELRLKIGDNDALSVSVAELVDAEALLVLSDVPGLYDRPPSEADAGLVSSVEAVTEEVFAMAGGSKSGVGTGGMATKVKAAHAATCIGIPVVIVDGRAEGVLRRALAGEELGTFFAPGARPSNPRRQWIAFGRAADGALVVDDGARRAILEGKRSLLAVGIREVRGDFAEGDTVRILGPEGGEVARGLVNFPADAVRRIRGRRSPEVASILGEPGDCVVQRENLVITG
ncbi:MAG: glutamate 5-kinase [Planctomycetes bacterium]|jgi:glutamate 5-kinase|nr:glutamate 5-kinase [Planctomycetota bacterium]